MPQERDSANDTALPKTRQQLQDQATDIYALMCGLKGLLWNVYYSEQNAFTQDSKEALLPITEIALSKAETLVQALDEVRS